MTEENKKKLIDAGRQDLIDAYEITQSGFAGMAPDGRIVDRRDNPEAIPIQENKMLGIPKSKNLREKVQRNADIEDWQSEEYKNRTSDYICFDCGPKFLTEEQKKRESVITTHESECGICHQKKSVVHMRHWNYLRKPKPINS